MKILITTFLLSVSLNSLASSPQTLEACIQSIKVTSKTNVKAAQLEKDAVKSLRSCFSSLKLAEKNTLKAQKQAIRKEKQRKSLEAKILKLQEKLKKS